MILQIFWAFIASAAFSLVLEVPKKHLLSAGAVGALGWAAYLAAQGAGYTIVPASFFSAFIIGLVSHIFARIFKTPVTIFLIAGILPLVPGAGMYRTVYYSISGDNALSAFYLRETMQIAGMIAIAIFIMDSFFRFILLVLEKHNIGKN